MLVFKLKPIGKKGQRSFRVIVQEGREKLHGLFAEDLGWYNPHTKKASLNKDRILYWKNVGAQPTVTTHNLFVSQGVISGAKLSAHKRAKKVEGAAADSSSQAEAVTQPKTP